MQPRRGRSASASLNAHHGSAHAGSDGEGKPIGVGNFSRPGFGRNLSHVPESAASSYRSTQRTTRDEQPRPASQRSGTHRRQHSQGYFEPSLPSSSLLDSSVSASQIAAQAAMHHPQQYHQRQRSLTSPHPPPTIRKVPQPIQTDLPITRGPPTPRATSYNTSVGGHVGAAATAANAAFPGRISPGLASHDKPPEKEHRLRSERSRINFFSKTKSAKDAPAPLPSPNKLVPGQVSALSRIVSPSMTSLADSFVSPSPSLYSLRSDSTSTLVPARNEEKPHRQHFLSRQKNKLKERMGDDHQQLSLSSASSNSRPLDPTAPNTLYSFAASPASPAGTFFTGLDIRHHAGRREKKKEDKVGLPFAPKVSDIDRLDLGDARPPPANSLSENMLHGFGLQNMRPEDAWDFLKAKLLVLFDGEELRIPVEDLNRLVNVHIQWSLSQRGRADMLEDFRILLRMGFQSLDSTLRGILDQRLVPHLVEMWLFVFTNILPLLQAVFLPLDLEFRSEANENDVRRIVLLVYRDTVILPRYEALKTTFSRLSLESINAATSPVKTTFDHDDHSPGRPGTAASVSSPRSLGSSSLLNDVSFSPTSRSRGNSNREMYPAPPPAPSFQPGHRSRGSGDSSKHFPSSLSASSSASGFPLPAPTRNISFRPPLQRRPTTSDDNRPDTSHVTETVGRILQCMSVLASLQSGDGDQSKVEDLARSIKLNWLGRGRVGRIRRGFVGAKSASRPANADDPRPTAGAESTDTLSNAFGGQLGAGAGGLGGASML